MAMKSRRKGKLGELEVADLLRENGFKDARRSQQYAGINGDSDVVGLPGIHIESKRTERLGLWQAVDQAKAEARGSDIPTVWHRSSRRPWIVILAAKDFLQILKGKR